MDYSGMKATKVSKKKLDTNISISRKTGSKAKRTVSKLKISSIVILFFLVVGLVGGYFGSKYAFASDTYQMLTYENGEADVYIGKDETYTSYTELGVKCVAFGKDISSDCTVTYLFRNDLSTDAVEVEGVDENTPGIYYAVYKCNNAKYHSVQLIRNIIVLKEEDDG
jgi:hypothetical protein